MDRLDRKDSIAALHRENIINAADELFTQNGFAHTTMDDIAMQAQYSKRTIYAYFTSKDEIYSHFVVKGVKALFDDLEKVIMGSEGFIERYHEICQVMSNFYNEQYPYYEGVMTMINQPRQLDATDTVNTIYSYDDKIQNLLELYFKEGQDAEIILQNVDIKKIVFIVWSNLLSFIELSSKKTDYITNTLRSTTTEFSTFGFNLILNAILDIG